MNRLVYFSCIILLLCLPAAAITTSGEITADETWSGTVTVTGDILVSDGVLTIEPGTVVRFALTNDNEAVLDPTTGKPFGNPGQIFFGINTNGCVKAIGTAAQPITFTTTSLFPVPGSWGQIHPMALTNDPVTEFRYCNFEYNRSGIGMRNDAGLDESSAPIVDHCTFRHFTNTGLYCSSGGAPVITNSVFQDMGSSGIFLHGANSVVVRNCAFYDLSVAVINAGLNGYDDQHLLLDHCVIHDADYGKPATPTWWSGYGIFHTNWDQIPDGTSNATVINSIISTTTLAGMKNNGWPVTSDYNCWYNNLTSIEDHGVEIGSHSLEADPKFTDPDNGDFTLQAGSPCIGTGSDGLSMGLVDADSLPPLAVHDRSPLLRGTSVQVEASPNPLHAFTEIRFVADVPVAGIIVTDLAGTPVRHLAPAADGIFWNGRTDSGERVAPGVYVVQLSGTGGSCRVVVK